MINLKRGISSSTKFKSTKPWMVAHGYQTMLTFDYKVLCQMKNSNEDSDFFFARLMVRNMARMRSVVKRDATNLW